MKVSFTVEIDMPNLPEPMEKHLDSDMMEAVIHDGFSTDFLSKYTRGLSVKISPNSFKTNDLEDGLKGVGMWQIYNDIIQGKLNVS